MSGVAAVPRAHRESGRSPLRHGVYACLLGNSLKAMREKETFVFVTGDPVYATILHNRRLTSARETRSVAPYWHLVLTIGPFLRAAAAFECAQRWVNCTRGCASKIRRGIELAGLYRVACYSSTVRPPGGALKYLRKHAPAAYVRAYQRLALSEG